MNECAILCNANKMLNTTNSSNLKVLFLIVDIKNRIVWLMETVMKPVVLVTILLEKKKKKKKRLHDKSNHQGFINTMHIKKTNLVQSELIQAHVAILIR